MTFLERSRITTSLSMLAIALAVFVTMLVQWASLTTISISAFAMFWTMFAILAFAYTSPTLAKSFVAMLSVLITVGYKLVGTDIPMVTVAFAILQGLLFAIVIFTSLTSSRMPSQLNVNILSSKMFLTGALILLLIHALLLVMSAQIVLTNLTSLWGLGVLMIVLSGVFELHFDKVLPNKLTTIITLLGMVFAVSAVITNGLTLFV